MQVNLEALGRRIGILNRHKDSINPAQMFQDLEPITQLIMIFQIPENMFYRSSRELGKEDLI